MSGQNGGKGGSGRAPAAPRGRPKTIVRRRRSGFWTNFNEWWRSYFEENGRRPNVEVMQNWYNTMGPSVWAEEEMPTWIETQGIAKGLRTRDKVRDYFRAYRKDKKEEKQRALGGPSLNAHGAGVRGAIGARGLLSLGRRSGSNEFGSVSSSLRRVPAAGSGAAAAASHGTAHLPERLSLQRYRPLRRGSSAGAGEGEEAAADEEDEGSPDDGDQEGEDADVHGEEVGADAAGNGGVAPSRPRSQRVAARKAREDAMHVGDDASEDEVQDESDDQQGYDEEGEEAELQEEELAVEGYGYGEYEAEGEEAGGSGCDDQDLAETLVSLGRPARMHGHAYIPVHDGIAPAPVHGHVTRRATAGALAVQPRPKRKRGKYSEDEEGEEVEEEEEEAHVAVKRGRPKRPMGRPPGRRVSTSGRDSHSTALVRKNTSLQKRLQSDDAKEEEEGSQDDRYGRVAEGEGPRRKRNGAANRKRQPVGRGRRRRGGRRGEHGSGSSDGWSEEEHEQKAEPGMEPLGHHGMHGEQEQQGLPDGVGIPHMPHIGMAGGELGMPPAGMLQGQLLQGTSLASAAAAGLGPGMLLGLQAPGQGLPLGMQGLAPPGLHAAVGLPAAGLGLQGLAGAGFGGAGLGGLGGVNMGMGMPGGIGMGMNMGMGMGNLALAAAANNGLLPGGLGGVGNNPVSLLAMGGAGGGLGMSNAFGLRPQLGSLGINPLQASMQQQMQQMQNLQNLQRGMQLQALANAGHAGAAGVLAQAQAAHTRAVLQAQANVQMAQHLQTQMRTQQLMQQVQQLQALTAATTAATVTTNSAAHQTRTAHSGGTHNSAPTRAGGCGANVGGAGSTQGGGHAHVKDETEPVSACYTGVHVKDEPRSDGGGGAAALDVKAADGYGGGGGAGVEDAERVGAGAGGRGCSLPAAAAAARGSRRRSKGGV